MSPSDEKMRGIKTRLLVSYPFFGSALSDLPIQRSSEVGKIYCNGASMLYNESFVENTSPGELAYWLCREILHLTMDYGERKKGRSRILWAISAEYSVNSILAGEGLASGVQIRFFRKDFSGKSTEEIYAILVREALSSNLLEEIEGMDSRLMEAAEDGDDQEAGLTRIARIMKLNIDSFMEVIAESQDRNREYGQYRTRTLELISKGRLSERTLGRRGFTVDLPVTAESLERIGWEDLLSAYAFNDRDSRSYRRFQRKYVANDIYLPQRYRLFNNIVVCIDVSASIDEGTLTSFFSDILYLAGSKAGEISIRLIQIDAKIQSDQVVSPYTLPEDILRRRGFGGTDFTALFSLLDKERNLDPVIIFTDGRGIFPEHEPEGYDVLWVTTDLHMPWGVNIEFGGEVESKPSY